MAKAATQEQVEQLLEQYWQEHQGSLITIGIQYLSVRVRHTRRVRFRVLIQPNRNRVLTIAVDRAGRRAVKDCRMTIPLKPDNNLKPRVLHYVIDSRGRVLPEQLAQFSQAA